MEGYVVEARVCCKRKTYVKPIIHDYSDKRHPNYFKFSCPVCDSLDNPHQVMKYEKNCPLCNVNLCWAESEEADKEVDD